jgi:hypothetical protein
MKHLTSQIVLIGSLSFCLTGLAQDKSDEKDVDFSVVPHIANINCGGDVRNATYTVKNQEEHATIFVDPVEELINHDNFPDDLVVVQDADAPGSLTTCDDTYLPPQGTCNVNLLIQPADCSGGVILGDIHRTLVVKVGTMQVDVRAEVEFSYSKMGAGDDFAILGGKVSNQGGGPVAVVGSVGHTGPLKILGQFNVTDGTFYGAAGDENNPAVLAAQTDFETAYTLFNKNRALSKCKTRSSLPQEVRPGYTCLDNPEGILINKEIHLEGTGEFIFFIGNQKTCFQPVKPPFTPIESCNLTFGSSVSFTHSDPNTPANVYWVVGNGITELKAGASIVGTILAGRGPILSQAVGVDHSEVTGRLWSRSQEITLQGGSVNKPDELLLIPLQY